MNLFFLFIAFAFYGIRHEDPECKMTTPEIIQHWGYPAEIYTVATEDGYILELHRIPHGKSNRTSRKSRPVVFLQHGLECSSANWVANLPNESAGFVFADAGFDVWLGNMRGNTYSTKHVNLSTADSNFWKWTWDEMANYDLESMIEKALNVSGKKQLYYIGHSQGTLTMFSKLSMDQVFSKKIRNFFALAPIGSVAHIKGMLRLLAEVLRPEFYLYFDIFGAGKFLPNNWIMKLIANRICGVMAVKNELCDNIIFLISGPEGNQMNKTRTPVYLSHTPADTSSMNVRHWIQMVMKGTVAKYDYGKRENIRKYRQSNPPEYNFTQIHTPIYLYSGDEDWLANHKDIYGYLIPRIKHIVLPGYTHLDFIWGLRAANDLYAPIVEIIKEAEKKRATEE
ncbi:unnamed protein product [Angiostrongylus costaricensis]|uniref:Lipase n=1 Tax=Angiostrongylus costaricensis TaxID=334426 RepID=A0A0R3PAE3_ANGCS|nr:unnamed protein product [Angiostrongylus costaricensis]